MRLLIIRVVLACACFFIFALPVAGASSSSSSTAGQPAAAHGDAHADEEGHASTNDAVDSHGSGHGHENLGEILPLWSCIPFACMLLSIALMPLLLPNFWHHHFGKISAFWAAAMGIPAGG